MKLASCGAVPEWTNLNARMQTCGSSALSRVAFERPVFSSYCPGREPAGTTSTHVNGVGSGVLSTPPFAVLGSFHMRCTSSCITWQVSAEAEIVAPLHL